MTGGASAKNLPPAGFLNAAGFSLFSAELKIHPLLRFGSTGEFRHLRMPTRGFALSLIHISFCRRQWALIHVEDQWAENYRTMDGRLFHQKAHDTRFTETRGDRVVKRGVRVYSATLGRCV